eukprot:scaffold6253_cov162-Pinguiococcus_pyrenoidosus.AAC.2
MIKRNVSVLSGRVNLTELIANETETVDDLLATGHDKGSNDGLEYLSSLSLAEIGRLVIFGRLQMQQDGREADDWLSDYTDMDGASFKKSLRAHAIATAQGRGEYLDGIASAAAIKRLVYYGLTLRYELDDAFSSAVREAFRSMKLPLECAETLFTPHNLLDIFFDVGLSDALDGNLALQRMYIDMLRDGNAESWSFVSANRLQFADMTRASNSFGMEVHEILASIESLR